MNKLTEKAGKELTEISERLSNIGVNLDYYLGFADENGNGRALVNIAQLVKHIAQSVEQVVLDLGED